MRRRKDRTGSNVRKGKCCHCCFGVLNCRPFAAAAMVVVVARMISLSAVLVSMGDPKLFSLPI